MDVFKVRLVAAGSTLFEERFAVVTIADSHGTLLILCQRVEDFMDVSGFFLVHNHVHLCQLLGCLLIIIPLLLLLLIHIRTLLIEIMGALEKTFILE